MSALVFTYSSGSTSFDREEVGQVFLREVQKSSKQRLQNGAPRIYLNGNPYKEIVVNFRNYYKTTHPKIETIKDITEIMTLRIYASDTSLSETLAVRIDPNITFPYVMGNPKFEEIQVGFIESTSGKAVVLEED